jgi:hypothetical protein
LSLSAVVIIGFLFWNYEGPGGTWFKYYATAAVYEIFWCLVVFLIWPQRRYASRIAAGVLLASCLLEVLQLWRPVFLQEIRATFIGAALIGTSFVWRQFPYYVAGAVIGYFWMRILTRPKKKSTEQGL